MRSLAIMTNDVFERGDDGTVFHIRDEYPRHPVADCTPECPPHTLAADESLEETETLDNADIMRRLDELSLRNGRTLTILKTKEPN